MKQYNKNSRLWWSGRFRAQSSKTGKKGLMALCCSVVLMIMCSMPAMAADNAFVMTESQTITEGATLTSYTWNISDGKVKASVLEIDLTKPYVQLQVVPGKGSFTQRATVTAMAERTGAIAMVNGDFFNMAAEGAPIGTAVIDGVLESSQSVLQGVYCLGITKDRIASIDAFTFEGKVSNGFGQSYPLSGLNKTYYWEEPTNYHSHIDRLHLYSDIWSGGSRGMDSYVGVPTEILVKNNIVQQISTTGCLEGGVPEGCYILHGDGKAAEYLQAAFRVGDSINIKYAITPDREWQMVIGGHALLLDNGAPVPYTKDLSALGGVRARTAVGISKDGRKVYIVAVEGRTGSSAGITLGNLSLLMQKVGAWKALNLDGGGSTAMVVRELAAIDRTRVINPERNGSERSVVEGLGVFTTAPTGTLKGAFISGEKNLLLGETQTYSVRAYDTYYNTIADTSAFVMTEEKGLGTLKGRTFTAEKTGTTNLSIGEGANRSILTIRIVGKDGIRSMALIPDREQFEAGAEVQFTVKAELDNSETKNVAPAALEWTLSCDNEAFDAEITDKGKLIIRETGNTREATVTASYDGFEASYTLHFERLELLKLTIDSTTMQKGDDTVQMDVAPMILNNRTMVPIRFVAEALEGEVYWDDGIRTAQVICNGNLVELPVDGVIVYVNGEEKTVDTPAQIIDGRTMVPLRFVAESFGMHVDYDDATRTISISEE